MLLWGIMMVRQLPIPTGLYFDRKCRFPRLFKVSCITLAVSWVCFFTCDAYSYLISVNSLGMRWLLGTFEAGLFPGVNYYLSWCVEC